MAAAATAPLSPDADLMKVAADRGIEYFLVCFVDIKGTLRSKMVPAQAIGQIQKAGAGFAPFAAWLDYGPDASDMVAIPDPSTLIQVPFQPELAFVIGDCYIEGEKVMDSPRWVLKQQVAKAAEAGYVFKTGVEPEFFLLTPDSTPAISDPHDRQEKPCYDAQALMRRYGVLTEIVSTLNSCGFGVYQTDHEDGNGQYEINWHYTDCLTTADRHVFFKWVTKTLAEKHGFKATFMPKPIANLSGNGCHCHCSLWKGDKNVFVGDGSPVEGLPGSIGLSTLALNFLGGTIAKANTFCAITNPTVNSYKRLNAQTTRSGSTWAPNRISWTGNNRTNMIRVPEGDRFEFRLADGAVNPYLLPAVLLASGLWGMDQRVDAVPSFVPSSVNMYTSELARSKPQLSLNLLDALRAFEQDPQAKELLGPRFVDAFSKLKNAEWADFMQFLSAWELDQTLDC